MWHHAHPDVAFHNAPHAFYRNTVKTGTPASESTQCGEDESHYRPGITSTSRRPDPRRTLLQDSSHHCRKRDGHPDKHHHHTEKHYHPHTYPRQALAQNFQLDSPYSSGEIPFVAYVGRLTKEQFIDLVAVNLDRRAEYNSDFVSLPTYSEPESVFFSVSRPEIPTKDYIRRLVSYTQCSPSAFVVMMVYLDRIARSNTRLSVTPYNMHRLLVTALTLACKMLDDRCFSNVHYAKVGGIPTAREMNRLELQFLSYLKYRLHVSLETYEEKQHSLEQPLPTSPVSLFEGTTAMSSSCDKDDLQSMVSADSGTSVSVSCPMGYHTKTDSSHTHYPGMQGSALMEKWHTGRNTVPPGDGKRVHQDMKSQLVPLTAQHMHLLNDMVP